MWSLSLQDKFYDLIASGRKTVEGRVYSGERCQYKIGDQITMKRNDGSGGFEVTITDLKRFPNFESMVKAYASVGTLLPNYDIDSGIKVYTVDLSIYQFVERSQAIGEDGQIVGVIAIDFKKN